MSIVLMNQFFWPDTVATSQLLTDLARQLSRDRRVIAICGATSGAGVDDGEAIPDGIHIVRTRTFSFGHSKPARLASYISYLCGALWCGLRIPRPDAFVTLTTPPILSIVGSILSIFHKSEHYIWEMDVYPDIACDIGFIKKQGLIDRFAGMLLDWSRRRATAIIVLGEDMKTRLISRGIPEEKIRVAESWADGTEIEPCSFPQGPIVVHYSGNLGLAHETNTVKKVIHQLRDRPDIRFVFAGGGSRRLEFESFCRASDFKNVEFRPYCSRSDLGRNLAEGHLGLVTQLPQTLGSIVPSKIYGIMAAGRPLLYIGPNGSTPARHIERFQCGWHIQPGDAEGLEDLLITLAENRELIALFGSRARIAFEHNFNRAIGISRVLRVLDEHSQVTESHAVLAESVKGDRL
jgi:colanic acid biosynthesis glycosyl transferase WcaI